MQYHEVEETMNDRQLYQKKWQAQLDEWQADVDKFKAKASGSSADAQLRMNQQIKVLEGRIGEGKARLAEVAGASEEAWKSIKKSGDSAWASLKSAVSDAASSLKG
jgi:hypothetical protein